MGSIEKSLLMLRNMPRVGMHNIKDLPEKVKERFKQHLLPRGKDAKYKLGANHKGMIERMSRPRIGFGRSTPSYLRVPREYYYQDHQ
jgi:hypothetical protein